MAAVTWRTRLALSLTICGSCAIAFSTYLKSTCTPQDDASVRVSLQTSVKTLPSVSGSDEPVGSGIPLHKPGHNGGHERASNTKRPSPDVKPALDIASSPHHSSLRAVSNREVLDPIAAATHFNSFPLPNGTRSKSGPHQAWNREQAKSAIAQAARTAKSTAWARARAEGWEPIGVAEGGDGGFELMAIFDNLLYVYETSNEDAGISANIPQATTLAAPTEVNGSSVTVGIWDQGGVLPTHQELSGRTTIRDDAYAVSHATHAGGTIMASGVKPSAKGMAPAARLDSYNWSYDLEEMTDAAMSQPREAGKIQVSSHSYGYVTGWANSYNPARWYGNWGEDEAAYFGMYDWYAKEWDKLCYGARYYLPFKSAGNNRSDRAPDAGENFKYYNDGWQTKTYEPSDDPAGDGNANDGYDTIPMIGNAKNVITVGAVNDAVNNNQRDLDRATMTSFSGWGPADDGRVKPDLVANGSFLYSSKSSSDDAYGNMSGTSMATPSAAGVGAVLLDAYNKFFPDQSMLASSLKGLMLHTADDIGNSGPDYMFGWGHINAAAAMDILVDHSQHQSEGRIRTSEIFNHETQTFTYQSTGEGEIKVTLCWTDPDGTYSYTLDDRAARLVNDLDLRVISPDGVTSRPFVLDPENPSAPASRGDNSLDNVEQVLIQGASSGLFEIEVRAPADITDGHQEYSLIVSGATASIAEPTEPASLNLSTAAQSDVDGMGAVRIDGVVSDGDSDTIALEVNCSINNGQSWEAASLAYAANETGDLAVDNTLQTQVPNVPLSGTSSFTVHWDTSSVVTYSEDTRIRIRAWDGTAWSEWSTSAPFTVNNQGPDLSQVEMTIASKCAFGRYVIQPEASIGFVNYNEDTSGILAYRYATTDDPADSLVASDFFFSVSELVPGTVNHIYLWAEGTNGRLSEPAVLDIYVLEYPAESEGTAEPGDPEALSEESSLEDVPFVFEASVSAGVPILRFPHQPGKVHAIECSEQLDGVDVWSKIPDTSFTVDNGWIVWVNDSMKAPDAPLYQFYRVSAE